MRKTIEHEAIDMRRGKVLQLRSRGKSQQDIAQELGVSQGLISQDLKALKGQAHEQIKTYVENTLPEQHQLARAGIEEVIKEAWAVAESADEGPVKIAALKLAMDAYGVKLSFLGDVSTIDMVVKQKDALKKEIEEIKKGKAGPVLEEEIKAIV